MNETTTTINVAELMPWSEPKEVSTSKGPRLLRKAPAPMGSKFWEIWRTSKEALKEAGISCSKEKDGTWAACWWIATNTAEVVEDKKAKIAASRAIDSAVEVPTPSGLNFFPFQKAGIAFANNLFNAGKPGCLIADSMGLGKTCQAIGVINSNADIARVLIVCPATLKIMWTRAIETWATRKFTTGIAEGKFFPPTQIVVINYDILSKHHDALRAKEWDLVIVDEAHACKNMKSLRKKHLFGHKAKKDAETITPVPAKRRLCMTGTAITNRPIELFPILNYLDPIAWPSFFSYAIKFCAAHKNGFGWDFSGSSNENLLQERLRTTLMIRRMKEEVLTDLPPKLRQIIELPSDGMSCVAREMEHYQQHEAELDDLKAKVVIASASDNPEEYTAAVEALRKGTQARFDEMAKLRYDTAMAAVPQVIEHLREALESAKVICFAHHRDVVSTIKAEFPNAAVVVGGMKGEDKQAEVDRFQNDPACTLFIGSMEACKEGLTLTAATIEVFAEQSWVPGVIDQCEARAHRIGQKNSVLVQHLVLSGSLGATMARRCVEKQEVIDAVCDDELTFAVVDQPTSVSIKNSTSNHVEATKKEFEKYVYAGMPTKAIHLGLKILAGVCDGAASWDGAGFNKIDSSIGKSFASQGYLSPKQSVIGAKLCNKYRGQFPAIYPRLDWYQTKNPRNKPKQPT